MEKSKNISGSAEFIPVKENIAPLEFPAVVC